MPLLHPTDTDGGPPPYRSFSPRTYQALAETFRALADPTRTQIIHLLAHGELAVNGLAAHLEVSPSAVSHQLRVLRQMGLVRFRREGQEAFYTLDDPHIESLFEEALRHVKDYLPHAGQGGEAP